VAWLRKLTTIMAMRNRILNKRLQPNNKLFGRKSLLTWINVLWHYTQNGFQHTALWLLVI